MSGNSIGQNFVVTTFGESHGVALGCVVDGCPPGMALAASDLQSDRRFCESFVRSRSQQGQGPRRIAQDLRQRGVADSLVREYLWEADIDWFAALQQLYRKRYGETKPSDYKEKAKRMRFLQYRGFDYDLIRDVLGDVLGNG